MQKYNAYITKQIIMLYSLRCKSHPWKDKSSSLEPLVLHELQTGGFKAYRKYFLFLNILPNFFFGRFQSCKSWKYMKKHVWTFLTLCIVVPVKHQ